MSIQGAVSAEYYECCSTEVRTVKFEYKWIIRNFRWMFESMTEITSSSFAIKDCPMTGSISIFPRVEHDVFGHAVLEDADIRVTLKKTDSTYVSHQVKCFGTDSGGMKRLIFETDTDEDSVHEDMKYNHKLPVKDLFPQWEHLVENDTLTISFEFMIKMVSTSSSVIGRSSTLKLPKSSSASNFRKLLEDPKYSDFTITVGTRKFKVHRNILATRSSVFAAMFEHKMKENESRNVNITDMSEKAVEEMLKFIYTNETEKLGDMTSELLDAAEKYDLQTLKDLCVYSLGKNLKFSNAAESLILADRYNLKKIKFEILEFISNHRNSVEGTNGYEALRENYPHLLLETYDVMIQC